MAKRPKKKKTRSSEIPAKVAGAGAVAQRLPSWCSRDWIWGLILVLAVILAYSPVWRAGYIWDDDQLLTANPVIIGPLGLKEIWTTSAADLCPLTLTTFWWEHKLWGLAPLPYHLANVLMHGACAVLLWRVLRSLQIPGAWLGAALWALHPVEVESVAWIAEMKNTQSGLFFLLSILFFVRWLRTRDLDKRTGGGWNYSLTLLFAALAMASKSSTVTLPVVLCLCAWWLEGRWQWRTLMKVGPIFLMSVAAIASTLCVNNWAGVETLERGVTFAGVDPLKQGVPSWPERLVMTVDGFWFYLGKVIWPHPLITIYPRWQIDAGQWLSYLPLFAVILVPLFLWLKRESWSRPWFFAFAYFLVALLPVLGLADRYVADHYQYLPSMGPLALAGAGMARLADFVIPGRSWLQSTLGAGVLLVLGLLSWQRAWVYESEETLWADTLAKNPNCWAGYNNLGNALLQKGQLDEAMTQFQKALAINPNYAEAHCNVGVVLSQKGQFDEAMAQYRKVLEIDPNYSEAHNNLGIAFFQKGQLDEAIAQYQKALAINPNDAEVHYNLGVALLQNGQLDDAIAQFQATLELNPGFAEAHHNLGTALVTKGRMDEAIARFQKALEINPNDAEAHSHLGNALVHKGEVDQALTEFRRALEINPNYAEAHSNLGIIFARKGQLDEAMAQYQKALAINPSDTEAYSNLGNVLLQKGKVDEAIAQYKNALEINPNYPEIHYNLGVALDEKGETNEAIAQYREALRLKPDFSAAQNNLAKDIATQGTSQK